MPEIEALRIVRLRRSLVASDHVNLSIERGGIRGVMDESRDRKTTVMNLLFASPAEEHGD